MKKLQFTLCTLLAVTASFNVHAWESGKGFEHPIDAISTARHNDHQLSDAQKNKAVKESQKQIEHDAKSGNATEEKYTQRIKELTDSSEPLTSQETQELAKNQESLKTIQDKKLAQQPTTGIPLDEAEAPVVEKTEENESNTETDRTDSTDSLKTVDLNEAEVMQDAQNVKDSSGVTSFIKSMVDRLFGKDANNPKVQDAMDQAQADAQAKQWWSPWDGSKFKRWYDNTMKSFKQIKESVPTLFSLPGTGSAMAAKVNGANFHYDSLGDSVYNNDISMDPWSSRDSIGS